MNIPRQNIKRILLASALALAIPLSASAYGLASGGHEGCGFAQGMGERMPPHLRALKLSDAQKDKVFEIMHAQAPTMRDKAKSLHQAEEALRALADSPDYSDAKATALVDTAARGMAELRLARVKTEHQVYELLTPEQRQKMADFKAHADDHRHGRGERHRRMAEGERGGPEVDAPPVAR